MKLLCVFVCALVLAACGNSSPTAKSKPIELLNVSYDPTRELYTDLNRLFTERYEQRTGRSVVIRQSHGGSGKQARAVIDGLEADVVSLAIAQDVDAVAAKGLIASNWQARLPEQSAPYSSVVVLVVRKGNPKNIRDWDDLAREGIAVITPNPKTGGGARLNYLAAWGYGLRKNGGDEQAAREFVRRVYRNVPVLDSGARGSTTTFVERGIGDVMIAWESEARLAARSLQGSGFEIVVPSITIAAEPPVAVVDRYVDKHGSRAVAEEYLRFLFSDDAQRIIAEHDFRPRRGTVDAGSFPNLPQLTINDFGGWAKAQAAHFADGAEFDRLFSPSP